MKRAGMHCVAATAVVAGALAWSLGTPTPVEAAIISSFVPPAFTVNQNGAIDSIGNTLLTCAAAAACTTAQASAAGGNNNSFTMVAVDQDGAAFTTTNSSRSALNMPAGSSVLWAGLYWGASSNSATRNTISFRPPGAATYAVQTGALVGNSGPDYHAFKDVTALVSAAGNGDYWSGNVQLTTGTNQYAGWSLVVVYRNPTLPMRNLTVFDGYGIIQNVTGDQVVDIEVSGFLAPPAGPVNAEIGVVAYEGDGATNGDALQLSNNLYGGATLPTFTTLSNAVNGANNFFNSSISDNGVSASTDISPSFVNTLGFDIDEVQTTGVLPNSSTRATLRASTGGDTYYPGVFTFSVDLYSPAFPNITKTVTDINGGSTEPGDTLEYRVFLTNTGLDPADSTIVRDIVPANTTFVPGSIVVGGVAQTDTVNTAPTDFGDYLAGTRTIEARVGTGATGTAGGTLGVNGSAEVRFRVTVDAAAAGSTIPNEATAFYRARTIAQDFTFTTNKTLTPVTPRADLVLTKSASPATVVAGENLRWTINVTNNGPNPADGVVVSDVLPAGLTLVSAAPASCTGTTTVNCALGALPVGSTTITVVGKVDPAITPGSLIVNAATVRAATADPAPGNESSSSTTPVVAEVDLAIVKTAEVAAIVPGRPVTYTLTVTNPGPSQARNVVISDLVPVAFTPISITSASAACTLATAICTAATMNVGQSVVVTITGSTDPAATTSFTNTARVSSAGTERNAVNNTATIITAVAPSADVSVTKTTLTNPVVAGNVIRYRLRVANNGPSTAAAVTVTDALPAGTAFVNASAAVGACSVTAGTLSCALGALGPTASVDVLVDVQVVPGASGTLANTTSVATTTADPLTANNTSTVSDPIVVESDLRIIKVVDQNPIDVGTTATWTVTVTNDGPSATSAPFSIGDTVPAEFAAPSLVSVTGPMTCSFAGNVLSCGSTGSLAVGSSAVVRFSALAVSAGAAQNTAVVAGTQDPNAANNSALAESQLTTHADVSIDKTWTTASALAGATAQFTLRVANGGPSPATAVSIADTLPPGLTVASLAAPDGACASTTPGASTVSCSGITLANGATYTVTVTVDIRAAQPAGPLLNTATTASATADRNPTNNSDAAELQILRSTTISLSKTASAANQTAGNDVTYTLVYGNTGPSTAEAAVIGDKLPAGSTFVSSPDCTSAGGVLTCNLGVVGVGASRTVTYTVRLDPSVAPATVLTNTATASTITPSNGPVTATANVTVNTIADLGVSKTASPNPATPGGQLSWTITYTNHGPSDARTVTVSDPLPTGFVVASVSATSGTCTTSATVVGCTVAVLAPGQSVVVTIAGTVAASATGSIVNTATVGSATTEATPNVFPNSATATVPLQPQADLVIAKTASVATIDAGGGNVSYTITAANAGPSNATSVVLTDTLPAGFIVSGITPAGLCPAAPVATPFTCNLGTLAAGAAAAQIVVTGSFPAAGSPGPTTNAVGATSATPLTNPANDTASAAVLVTTHANLIAAKKASPDPITAGTDITWVLQVGNSGPSVARSATLADAIPAGIALASVVVTAPPGVVCDTAALPVLTCTLGDIAVGELRTVIVVARVNSVVTPGVDALVNTITAASPTDADGAVAASATDVVAVSDVLITKTGPAEFVAGAAPTNWTITVTNNGPSTARTVVITDPAVTGMSFGAPTYAPTGLCAGALPCTIPSMAPGATLTITLPATINQAFAGASITNSASVTALDDANLTDNSVAVTVPVRKSADLELRSKVDSPDPVVAGQTLTYTLNFRNAGPSQAANVVIVDPLPAGVTVVPSSLPAGCVESPVATVRCTIPTLNATTNLTSRAFQVTVGADAATGTTLTNTATISSDTADPGTFPNTATATTTVNAVADIAVTKTASPSPAVPGQTLTYTITVTNNGPSIARAVTMSDTTLATFVAGSVTATATSGTCTTVVVCALGDVPAAAGSNTVTVTISGTVKPDQTAAISNSATVATTTGQGANTAADSVTISTPVGPMADVSIDKVLVTNPVVPGRPVRFELRITNAGPSTARAVTVTDTLAAALGGGAVAAPFDTSCALVGLALTCNLGAMDPGTSTIVVDADLAASFTGSLSNSATVSTSSNEGANVGPNSDSVNQAVAPSADLQITKVAAPDPVAAGAALTYTITVTNLGPSTAVNALVNDVVPAGLSGVTVSGGGCTAFPCTRPTVSVGSPVVLTVTGTVDPALLSLPTNTVTVSSPTPDPVAANNSSSATPVVVGLVDVGVTKAASLPVARAGEAISWTIDVSSAGPSTAANVRITDTLPIADLVAASVAIVPSVGSCGAADGTTGAFTCALGALAPTDHPTLTVTATVKSTSLALQLLNAVTITTVTDQGANTIGDSTSTTTPLVRSADPQVAKSAVSAAGVAGQDISFDITVSNPVGPSAAQLVDLRDEAPIGTQFVSATVIIGTATCTATTAVVTCTPRQLDVGQSYTVRIVLSTDPAVAAGDPIENGASITTTTPDSDTSNNRSTAVVTMSRIADIGVAKTVAPATVNAGEPTTWTITVANYGPSVADGVTLTDVVPAGFTIAAVTDNVTPDACSLALGAVACDPFSLSLNASLVVTVAGAVDPDVVAGPMLNAATIATPTPQGPVGGSGTQPDSATATLTVATSADLRASKSVTPDPAVAGGPIQYIITVVNDGPSDARNVVINDTFPTELVPGSIVVGGDCSALSCTIPTVPAGATVTVTVDAAVRAGVFDVGTNVVTVASDTADPNSANNAADADPGLARLVDLSIRKSAPGAAIAGDTIQYTLDIANAGPSDATNVVIEDVLPSGLSLVLPLPAGCTQPSPGTLRCVRADVRAGDAGTITAGVTIDPAQPTGPISNTATITNLDGIPDSTESDNSSTVATDVAREAQLVIGKVAVLPAGVVGGTIGYDVTVTNNGLSTAENVTIADAAPVGTTVVSTAPDAGLTCTTTVSRFDCAADAPMAVGDSLTVRVTLLTDYRLPDGTVIANTANADTSTPLAAGSVAEASADVTLAEAADVLVQKSVAPTDANAGEPGIWTIQVTNTGLSDADAVVLSDTLPSDFIDAVVVAQTLPGVCAVSGQDLSCSAVTLLPGEAFAITIGGRVDPAFTGTTISNTASIVTTSNQGADARPDADSAAIGVGQQAKLTLVKSGPTTVVPGVVGGITWAITVTNGGPSDAQAVVVGDPVPAGVSIVSVSASPASCTALPCSIGTLAAGASTTITVIGTVAADATATITNTATVTTATDTDPASVLSASIDTTLTPRAALIVTKAGPAAVNAGEGITWTITVTNNGPSAATSLTIDDVLPAGLVGTPTIAGDCTALPCNVASLAPAAVATVTITSTVDPARTADITNTATVTSPVPPPSGGDTRSATLPTAVNELADITVAKTGTDTIAGQATSWTITVTNNGPSDAVAVTVSDLLDGALTSPVLSPAAPGCALTGQQLDCAFTVLPAHAVSTITVDATVAASYTLATLDNTVTVTSPTDPTDNAATGTIAIDTLAALTLGKAGPVEAVPGLVNGITWTLTVANSGPSDAQGVMFHDVIPASVTVTSVTPSQGTCTALPCNIGTLATGASATVTVVGTVAAGATGTVTNAASVSAVTSLDPTSVLTDAVTTTLVPGAGLTIAKTGPPRVNAGTTITWTITVRNAGPSVATDLVIEDPLPLGVVPGSEVVAGDCTALPCAVVALAVGATATFTITATIDPAATADLSNTATVTSPVPSPVGGDVRSSTLPTIVDELARLRIVKTLVQPVVTPGAPIRWQLEVVNDGPSDAVAVSINDTVPLAALTDIVISSTSGCAALPCALARLSPGIGETVFIDATVVSSLTDPTLANTATVASPTPDDNVADNSSTAVGPVAPLARLSITKMGPTSPVVAGTPITWLLTVHNAGPSDAQNVLVLDQLPPGVDPATVVVNGAPATCALVGRDLSCTLASLAANGPDLVVSITATALDTIGRSGLDNAAAVSSSTADDFDTDNSASAFTATEPIAAVVVSGTAAPATVAAGTSAAWTFHVSNTGPSAAADLVVTVPVPASLTVAGPLTLVGAPAGSTVQIIAGQIIVALSAQLRAGASFDITFDATVASTFLGSRIDLTATAVTSTPEPTDGTVNNAATAGVNVVIDARLSFTKTAPTSVNYGSTVDFALTITNAGPSAAQGLQIVDTLPTGLTAVAASVPCAIAGQRITCANLTVAAGATLVIIVTAQATGAGPVTNTAQLTCQDVAVPTQRFAPEVAGCTAALAATAAVEIVRHADVVLSKVASASSATVGDTITYTIAVTNNGPDPVSTATVVEQPPAGLQLVSITADQGAFDPTANRWALTELAPGRTATLTVTAKVAAAGQLINVVTMSLGAGMVDPTPAASASAAVSAAAGALPRTGSSSTTWMLIVAALLVLGGIAVAVSSRRRR